MCPGHTMLHPRPGAPRLMALADAHLSAQPNHVRKLANCAHIVWRSAGVQAWPRQHGQDAPGDGPHRHGAGLGRPRRCRAHGA